MVDSRSIKSQRRRALVAVGATAGVAGLTASWWKASREAVDSATTKPVPAGADGIWSLSFPTPSAGTLRLADLRQQGVILNFWATWCPPCVREFPMLDEFHRVWSTRGWSVVGLAVDQPQAVQTFLKQLPVSFPIGIAGADGLRLSRELGNAQGGLPFSVAIDARNAVKGHILGEATPQKLELLVSS